MKRAPLRAQLRALVSSKKLEFMPQSGFYVVQLNMRPTGVGTVFTWQHRKLIAAQFYDCSTLMMMQEVSHRDKPRHTTHFFVVG